MDRIRRGVSNLTSPIADVAPEPEPEEELPEEESEAEPETESEQDPKLQSIQPHEPKPDPELGPEFDKSTEPKLTDRHFFCLNFCGHYVFFVC